MKDINTLQRKEAGKRLSILGYNEDVCNKYMDETFLLKLQEAESADVPEEININPFLQMEKDENIFTYLYRYSVIEGNKLQLRMFFVSPNPDEWENDRQTLRIAMKNGIDSDKAKNIFRTYIKSL